MARKGIREENYAKIIDVGKMLFITQGVDNTTLAQIAGRAGVAKKTILNIFNSKNSLVYLCAMSVWDDFYAQLDEETACAAFKEKCGLEQLLALQVFRAKLYADHPNYADLIMEIESINCKSEEERQFRSQCTKKETQLFAYLEKAQKKGEADGSIKLAMNRTQSFTFLFVWFGSIIQRFGHIQQNSDLAQSLDIYTIMRNTLQQMRYFLQSTNQATQQEATDER